MEIWHAEALVDMRGLDGLELVLGRVDVRNNPVLEEIHLGSLRSADDLFINDNPRVQAPDLGSLVEVWGLALLQSDELVSLEGFGALEHVHTLSISRLPSLRTLDGLESLVTARTWLQLRSVPLLESTAALSGVEWLGELLVEDAPSLAALGGLDAATHATEVLLVDSSLADASALSSLETVDLDVEIRGTSVQSLLFLSSLRHVGDDILIVDNPDLVGLLGLQGVESIAGDLVVTGSPSITELEFADLVATIGPENIGGEIVFAP